MRVAFATLLLLGAACGSSPSSAAPSPSPSPQPSTAKLGDCSPVDLRTREGEQINLNGTWVTELEGSRGGIYYFKQVGSCVWFAGGFAEPSDPDVPSPLSYVTVVFRGTVHTDFTITGDWADVREQFRNGQSGVMTLSIEVDDAGEVHLVHVGGTGRPFIEPGIREEQSWIRISDGGAYPPPSPKP